VSRVVSPADQRPPLVVYVNFSPLLSVSITSDSTPRTGPDMIPGVYTKKQRNVD